MIINRRSLITGVVSLVAAPAIVRASSLMPVRALPAMDVYEVGDILCVGGLPFRIMAVSIRAYCHKELEARQIGGDLVVRWGTC